MLRIPAVILLALCVIAMPSYAAIACGSACETSTSATHEHDCCPTGSTIAAAHADDGDSSHDSKTPGRHHCAAPCCGFVAHVLTTRVPPAGDRPLADSLPSAAVVRTAVDHDAIFHPPRA